MKIKKKTKKSLGRLMETFQQTLSLLHNSEKFTNFTKKISER